MNADTFRSFYNYHFAMNRFLWNQFVVPLTDEQFLQDVDYSLGSVRNHVVHMINVDAGWFHDLQGLVPPEREGGDEVTDRAVIRARGDIVEAEMRVYLATLTDEMLAQKPIQFEPDNKLFTWQVLLHVANHATDHRAQVLRAIHDMGFETAPQDYVFYLFDTL